MPQWLHREKTKRTAFKLLPYAAKAKAGATFLFALKFDSKLNAL